MLFSVIICTHNRVKYLERALESACDQGFPEQDYEVIVVDNDSSDPTRQLVRGWTERYANVRYVYEEKIGLSTARNRGVKEARGKYLVFIDDDVILSGDYLDNACRLVESVRVSILGGPVRPHFETPPPRWYRDAYDSAGFGTEARRLGEGEFLIGCNLILHKEVFRLGGSFSAELGMRGKSIAYGEEMALQKWVDECHPELVKYYDPGLEVRHTIRPEKMSWPVIARQRFMLGRTNLRALSDQASPFRPRHLAYLLIIPGMILFDGTLGVLLRDRRRYPYAENYYYERVMEWFVRLGRLVERIRMAEAAER